ncbi:MAG TPA: hypothetical protein VGJ22_00535 [Anaerolineales bacterium]
MDAPIFGGAAYTVLMCSALCGAPLSLVLLWLYRRAVIRNMSRRAETGSDLDGAAAASSPTPGPAAAITHINRRDTPDPRDAGATARSIQARAPEFVFADLAGAARGSAAGDLSGRLRWYPCQAALIYLLGGLAFAFVLSLISLIDYWPVVSPIYSFLFLLSLHLWPAVLVVNLVGAATRRGALTLAAAYFIAYTLLGVPNAFHQGTVSALWGTTWWTWIVSALLPTVLLLGFLAPRARAVGPLVFTFLAFVFLGWNLLVLLDGVEGPLGPPMVALVEAGLPAGLIVTLFELLGVFLMTGLGCLALLVLRGLYLARWVNDQSLLADSIFLIFAINASIDLSFDGAWLLLSGAAGFMAYKFVTWIGLALWRQVRLRRARKVPQLLLLRVFSLGKRSEALYRDIARAWRYVGNLCFISGPDLAAATVEPHRFLDYLSGRLNRNFIDSRETLERRMVGMQRVPDLEGRFRAQDYFCYEDTWKMVLRRLAAGSDAVLMDLRGFTPKNAGCIFEIQELVQHVDLERVTFVIDSTTDEPFLRQSVEEAWGRLEAESPNHGHALQVRLFRLRGPSTGLGTGSGDVQKLLNELAGSVGPAPAPLA